MTLPASAEMPNYPFPANARQYDFEFLRMLQQAIIGHSTSAEGIAGTSDNFAATPATGLSLTLNGGRAFVKGDDRSTQGSYFCFVPTSQTVTAQAANATNPRIDRLVLRVYDADVSGATTKWAVEFVTGTPTAGATLTNLSGAAAVPNTALLLANVLVPAGFTGPFVAGTHIQDRRFGVPVAGRELFGGYAASTANSAAVGVGASGDLLGGVSIVGDGSTPVMLDANAVVVSQTAALQAELNVRDTLAATTYARAPMYFPAASVKNTLQPESRIAGWAGSRTMVVALAVPSGGTNATAFVEASATQPFFHRYTWGS